MTQKELITNDSNNRPISEEEFRELNLFTNSDIDIATVEFRESTTMEIADMYDIENFSFGNCYANNS